MGLAALVQMGALGFVFCCKYVHFQTLGTNYFYTVGFIEGCGAGTNGGNGVSGGGGIFILLLADN